MSCKTLEKKLTFADKNKEFKSIIISPLFVRLKMLNISKLEDKMGYILM